MTVRTSSEEQLAFFNAMIPVLIANMLTVAFVYCFAKITQKELEE